MAEQRRVSTTPVWRLWARRKLGPVIATLAVLTVVFGLGGFAWQYADSISLQTEQNEAKGQPAVAADWSIPVYKTVQLFLLNAGAEDDTGHPSNWLLIVARLSAALLFLVVSSAVIWRYLEEVRKLPRLLNRSGHVVIAGLGRIGLQLVDDLQAQGKLGDVIVVENNPNNPWIDYARNLGATVVIGDSTKADTLAEARAERAQEVFIVNGDDGVNLEVAAELEKLLKEAGGRRPPLRAYLHIVDTNFATTLRPYCGVLYDSSDLAVQIFNVSRTAATQLVTRALWPFAPKERGQVAHFVLVGFGAMGQAVAVQLAQLGHFPNGQRCRMTIADRGIDHTARCFLSRFPRFTSWTTGERDQLGVSTFSRAADAWAYNAHPLPAEIRVDSVDAIQYACNARFVELPFGRGDERFAKDLAADFRQEGVYPVIVVCGQQDRENFEIAVDMRDHLVCEGFGHVPIFVWLPRQPALAQTLQRDGQGHFFPFGGCEEVASYREITTSLRDKLGRKIHEDYEHQVARSGSPSSATPWGDLRDDLRESNRVAADHLLVKLAVLGLRLREDQRSSSPIQFDSIPGQHAQILAEMEHNRWVAERLLAGWRYAPQGATPEEMAANKKRKLNHNLVPWEMLGEEKKKDFDQVRTVLRECQQDGWGVERMDV